MKGVIFTEFLEQVESSFGMETADKMITGGCPFHSGAFTAVGSYDYRELISMVEELSRLSAVPSSVLVKSFGKRMFSKFLNTYPDAFERVTSTFELLLKVEETIHVEVRKLNPEAELPTFRFPATAEGCLDVIYESTRPFADLAEGLIAACIEHYGEQLDLERTDLPGTPGCCAKFSLTPKEAVTV